MAPHPSGQRAWGMDTGGGSYGHLKATREPLVALAKSPYLKDNSEFTTCCRRSPSRPLYIPGLELMCSHKSVFPSDVPPSTVSSGARGPLPTLSR